MKPNEFTKKIMAHIQANPTHADQCTKVLEFLITFWSTFKKKENGEPCCTCSAMYDDHERYDSIARRTLGPALYCRFAKPLLDQKLVSENRDVNPELKEQFEGWYKHDLQLLEVVTRENTFEPIAERGILPTCCTWKAVVEQALALLDD